MAKPRQNEKSENIIAKMRKLIPYLNNFIDTQSFEELNSIYSEKAANAATVHGIIKRLERWTQLLAILIIQKEYAVNTSLNLLPALTDMIRNDIINANDSLLEITRIKAAMDVKQRYLNDLKAKIEKA